MSLLSVRSWFPALALLLFLLALPTGANAAAINGVTIDDGSGAQAADDASDVLDATEAPLSLPVEDPIGGAPDGVIVKGGLAAMDADGNTVEVSGVVDNYSVLGGASLTGDSSGNTVTVTGTGSVGDAGQGSVVGGFTMSATGSATANNVNIQGGAVELDVIGGGASTGKAGGTGQGDGNTVTIIGGTVGRDVYGGAADTGGGASDAHAQNNSVTINATGAVTVGGDVTGGGTNHGDANDNTVSIGGTAAIIAGSVYGGHSDHGDANDNTVSIGENVTISGSNINVFGGRTSTGSADGNKVTIDGGAITGSVHGAVVATDGSATENEVTITGGTITGNIYGAVIDVTGDATSNTVTISGGTITGFVRGGDVSTGTAHDNTVNINGGTIQDVTGGDSNNGSAHANTVNISNGTITGSVIGGDTVTGSSTANIVNITGGAINNVYGGYAWGGSGTATGNTVNIDGSAVISQVTDGGYNPNSSQDMFTGNTLNKKSAASQLNGTTGNFAAVNFEYSGNANIASLDTTVRGAAASLVQLNTGTYDVTFGVGNTITGSGGIEKLGAGILTLTGANSYTGGTTVSAGTLAGDTDSLQGPITNNAAVLFDQSTNGTYAGDMSGSGSLSKTGAGTLTLTGTNSYTGMTTVESGTLALGANQAYLKDLTLYGGATFDRSVYNHSLDNGSLTVRGEGATYAGDLSAVGATLNFIAPVTVSQALLTVNGNADISSSSVNVGLTGGTALPLGTQLTLIDASGSLTANNLSEGGGIMESGVTTIYGLALSPDPMTGTLTGTVISRIASGRSKALSEGFVSGLGLVSQGADLIAGQGLREAVRASRETGYGLAAFGGLAGGSLRYNSGSHVDLGSLSFLAGLSYGVDLASASLTLGAFFEYGNGSYDTYNSFSNAASVHGDGDLSHVGGGLLGRLDFPGAGPGLFYVEASGRAGGVRNDYGSSDLRDPQGRRAEYDSSSAYYGFHFGTGYVWNLTETASLDLYGKYFWTRQDGDSVILSTGDRVAFADADSSRLRLGGRLAWALNEYVSPYFGAAYEHEFDGRARATANGLVAIEAPSLGGNTGIGELGLTLKPSQSRPLSLDLGLQGYTGRKEGLTGSLQLRIEF